MTPKNHAMPALWACLVLYAAARVLQLYAGAVPSLLIVIFHVVPPALFALIHGAALYRTRGILAFTACCLGVATVSESLSIRTGFPFGHYYFTDLMGPKILDLPPLLVLAYLGMAYASWILALLILGYRGKPLAGRRAITQPLLAAFIMLAWDLSMEADWATIVRAWIWKDGGLYFGVPLTNFSGWYLTAYLFYQAFAFYCRAAPAPAPITQPAFWRAALFLYMITAVGNLLVLLHPMAAATVADATGKVWATSAILTACTLVSQFLMMPLALLAWRRLSVRQSPQPRSMSY
jgi:putative membrane protein